MVTPHISVVQVPVNAIGKNKSSVCFLPKLSLNLTCFGPSDVFEDNVKSGALVPTASGIGTFSIGSTSTGSKRRSTTHHGTFLVASRNRVVCRWSHRHGDPNHSWNDHHSRCRRHSPHGARAAEERCLGDDWYSCLAYARQLRPRFSGQLFRREIFWRDQMGDL